MNKVVIFNPSYDDVETIEINGELDEGVAVDVCHSAGMNPYNGSRTLVMTEDMSVGYCVKYGYDDNGSIYRRHYAEPMEDMRVLAEEA